MSDLEELKQEIIKEAGEWNAHDVEYAPGKYTIGSPDAAQWIISRAFFFGMLGELFLRKPLCEMRFLDIGCFEGGISYLIAKQGAKEVVGLEIREAHLRKCEFLKKALDKDSLSFIKGDMLRLDDFELEAFDVIIMAGTLYHIDAPDLLPVLRSLKRKCSGIVILDTHVAQCSPEYFDTETNLRVCGRSICEHSPMDSDSVKSGKPRASYQNVFSFWPTERSLINLLSEAGFSFVFRPMIPVPEWPFQDRGYWIASALSMDSLTCRILPQILRDPDPRPRDHKLLHNVNHHVRKNPNTNRLY